jgi:methionyl-tRNA formyltransferase
MNILFWGTPDYAVPTLVALHQAGHTLVGVVTQPDRRRGRGKTLIPSPVKAKALEMGLKVFTPQRIKQDESCQEQLAELQADLSVVVAFGQILPKSVLDQPPLGCWNGHGSLLPRWRGAGPIQWALLEGDAETGVGVMAMEEGLDTGPVLIERSLAIGLLDNGHTLAERMSALTADLMVEAMPLIALAGHGSEAERRARLKLSDQADRPGEASYARMLTKQDHQIDWSASALTIHRKVMALYPNAVTIWNDKRLKLLHCEPLIERLREELPTEIHPLIGHWATGEHPPGIVLESVKGVGIVVSTSGCPILVRAAQLEGKGRSEGDSLLQQINAQPKQSFGTFA